MTPFAYRQCSSDDCRFRFPAELDHPRAADCPVCGQPTVDLTPIPMQTVAASPASEMAAGMVVVVDNLRSAQNVGSILRSAEALSITTVHLCGITPPATHKGVRKTALGAEERVTCLSHPNTPDLIQQLKKDGYTAIAIERTPKSTSLYEASLGSAPLALIFGNERAGVDPAVLNLCNAVYHLPMTGIKASLNVSVAFGIAAYHLIYGHKK